MSEQCALYSSLYGESRSSKAPENQNGKSGEDSYSPSVHSPNSIKAEKGEESAVLAQSQWPPASLEEASTSQLIHRHSTSAANKSEKRMVNRPDRTESVHTEKTYEEPALFSQNKNLEATLQEMKQSLREEFDCIIQESLQDFKEEIKEMLKKEKKLIRKSIQTALQEEKNRIIDLVQLVQDAVSEDRQQSTQQQSGLQVFTSNE
ncbi:uncharacterized protein PF3D7_1120000-like [Saccostrea echinata]|uniref:uncharacterized protein PF3D7_1120000-like n=1 Tax=Saccostrea echinata TaxID=191078 RepID=UPI002A803171|nr:uncharacterized protein PF3D7_1120000-like [Saccostrea echinata]